MEKKKIIVITGPTASGKTALSIALARAFNGEIISADSMQIYEGMDIATAKPTADEMGEIPHHLIGFVPNDRNFSVSDYVLIARKKIDEVLSRGKVPFIVGGTGLYINSLIDNVNFDRTDGNPLVREKYFAIAKEKGNEFLWEMLNEVDPKTASELHFNNLNRVVRALEVYEVTGKTIALCKEESLLEESPYQPYIIGLNYRDREVLYDRINKRVDLMIENGLLEEGKAIFDRENLKTAVQAIGYKELIPYFSGDDNLDKCVEVLKMQTRRYAKRQLTWFRRDERVNWIYLDDFDRNDEILLNIKINIEKFFNLC